MSDSTPHFPSQRAPSHGAVWLAAAVITVAGICAYHNSFDAPFVFDDLLSIAENPSIRRLGSFEALRPPSGQGLTVEGRPLLNLSLALNYAISGRAVWSYHALNLAIHLAAALALFGLVRRTLRRPGPWPAALRASALPLASAVALLWALHPLQTESVTYVVQRAESLMGLFLLCAFYAFVRGIDGDGDRRWFAASVAAALCGAASKEVTAVVPVMVLLYDRTFVAGSFRAAWRERGRVHLALMSCWLLIALLVVGSGSRGGTVGFGSNVRWGAYALTQFEALAHYVRLTFWPNPLIFDYGVQWVGRATDILPAIVFVLALGIGSLVALSRWPVWGFLGVWFFAPLAPTSLIPGNRQTIAEHRMYLPLAALVVAAVVLVFLLLRARPLIVRLGIGVAAAVAFGGLTVRRNSDYRTELALYRDTVMKRPQNGFAHYNLGKTLAESGAAAEAVAEYDAALRLMPGMAAVHYNRGNALAELGRFAEAIEAYGAALQAAPAHVRSHYNLGNVLVRVGRRAEAKEHFAAAVALEPGFVDARANLGGVLLELGELEAARVEFEQVIEAEPALATAHFNLGNVHLRAGRPDAAAREFERALHLDPQFAPARDALRRLAEPGVR